MAGGYRAENVEEVAPGVLMVRGEQGQHFENSYLFIVYEAGRNGYLANYKIVSTIDGPAPVVAPEEAPVVKPGKASGLSASCLQSCGG